MNIDSLTSKTTDPSAEPLLIYEEHQRLVHRRFELYPSHIIYLGKDAQGDSHHQTIQLKDLKPEAQASQAISAIFVMCLVFLILGIVILYAFSQMRGSQNFGGLDTATQSRTLPYLVIGLIITLMSVIGLITNKLRIACLKIFNHKGKEVVRIGLFGDDKAKEAAKCFGQAICDQIKSLQDPSTCKNDYKHSLTQDY